MTEWYIALPVTILLIVLSGFFVIIEFALLAVRRNRLALLDALHRSMNQIADISRLAQ